MNPGEGGTLGIFGLGCADGTLEPLAYTRARSSEFCYPILDNEMTDCEMFGLE